MKIHVKNPTNESSGNLPMLTGTLKPLLTFGFLYLKTITQALTKANVRNAEKLVNPATTSILPETTKEMEMNMEINIEIHGVLLFL